jgi:hypothetical protein
LPEKKSNTDIGLMVTAGDVTLSDGNLDVSGTGTFGEAAATITTGGLAVSAGAATIGVRSRVVDWLSCRRCYHYRYRFNGHRDVTLSDLLI